MLGAANSYAILGRLRPCMSSTPLLQRSLCSSLKAPASLQMPMASSMPTRMRTSTSSPAAHTVPLPPVCAVHASSSSSMSSLPRKAAQLPRKAAQAAKALHRSARRAMHWKGTRQAFPQAAARVYNDLSDLVSLLSHWATHRQVFARTSSSMPVNKGLPASSSNMQSSVSIESLRSTLRDRFSTSGASLRHLGEYVSSVSRWFRTHGFPKLSTTFSPLVGWLNTLPTWLASKVPKGFEAFYEDAEKKPASKDPSGDEAITSDFDPVAAEAQRAAELQEDQDMEQATEKGNNNNDVNKSPKSGDDALLSDPADEATVDTEHKKGADTAAQDAKPGTSTTTPNSDTNAKEDEASSSKSETGGLGNKKKKKKKIKWGATPKPTPDPDSNETMIMRMLTLAGLLLLLLMLGGDNGGTEVSLQQFISQYLMRGLVEELEVNDKKVIVKLRPGTAGGPIFFTIGSIESFEHTMDSVQTMMKIPMEERIPIKYSSRISIGEILWRFLPTMLLVGLLVWQFRAMSGGMGAGRGGGGGGPMGRIFQITKANPSIITKETQVNTTFKDVAGLSEAKVEIMEFVSFLKNPDRFTNLGARLPKGALLVGDPGTGKTLLARATAGEAEVPFLSMSGSDFLEMFVGVGPARVRDLFKQAREQAPCIIFIDEIDAVGRSRSKGGFGGGNDERENTLNQLLVEMDGFTPQTGVVVFAGTNRADILDSALLRPGRFDRRINIDKPDIAGRVEIFEVHLKPLRLKNPINVLARRLASLTPGFSGADIANLCNEAALIAARNNHAYVKVEDFENATDRVIGGLEKKKLLDKYHKKLVAYHEAGHAVAGWFLEHADPVLKVTIVPRGGAALGYAQYLPNELFLMSRKQIKDKMCMALGGRCSEQLFFDEISSGASDDLKKTTRMAYAYVAELGMSEKVGHLNYSNDQQQEFFKPYSEKTAELIDEEVQDMVQKAYDRTMDVLKEHKDKVEELAERLIKDETVTHDVIVSILGERAYGSEQYNDYVRHKASEMTENEETSIAEPSKDINPEYVTSEEEDAAGPEDSTWEMIKRLTGSAEDAEKQVKRTSKREQRPAKEAEEAKEQKDAAASARTEPAEEKPAASADEAAPAEPTAEPTEPTEPGSPEKDASDTDESSAKTEQKK